MTKKAVESTEHSSSIPKPKIALRKESYFGGMQGDNMSARLTFSESGRNRVVLVLTKRGRKTQGKALLSRIFVQREYLRGDTSDDICENVTSLSKRFNGLVWMKVCVSHKESEHHEGRDERDESSFSTVFVFELRIGHDEGLL